jgi:hypothetical protein
MRELADNALPNGCRCGDAVTWLRSPWWDGFWIFSGLPIGAALMTATLPWTWIFSVYLVLNSGHLLAPIGMAWSHSGFRQIMLAKKRKYILLPVVIVVVGVFLGATVGKIFDVNPLTLGVRFNAKDDIARPFVIMIIIYFIWNAYHFGMQNYGFLRLYWPTSDHAKAMRWAMFVTIFCMIILPEKFPYLMLFFMGTVIINHQTAAIGLASHVWAEHHDRTPLWFAATFVMIGALIAWLILNTPPAVSMVMVGLRVAVGFVHFLYDRWVYKLSDPQVRATIGRDIFCLEPISDELGHAAMRWKGGSGAP